MSTESADSQKIPYLEWLWLQHSDTGSEFYPLAHLILSNAVDPSPWKNKSSLNPVFVQRDIEALYATRRPGVTVTHVDLARTAVQAYMDDDTTMATLVETRKRESLRAAQSAPFEAADIPLTSNTSALQPRCIHTYPTSGRPCTRRAEPGDTRCARHGGRSLTPEELAEIYSGAKDRLIAATEEAVDITIDLMHSSPSDEVRRKAAEMILDRTGLVPGQVLTINTSDPSANMSPAEILVQRLKNLAKNSEEPKEVTPAPSSDTISTTRDPYADVVDAELVEEDSV